ncbi:unnamed protein product [Parajaminaea phylloscopi]
MVQVECGVTGRLLDAGNHPATRPHKINQHHQVEQPRPPTTDPEPTLRGTEVGTSSDAAALRLQQQQQRQPLLRIRVLSVERRPRDLAIRFDAQTNIGSFRKSYYQPFTRTYAELALFVLSLSVQVPTHILAALPLPTPALVADNNLADGRLLCYTLARWFSRLTNEAAHRDHAETRNFVETDYSYHPLPPNEDYAPPLVYKRWHAVMAQAAQEAKANSTVSIDVVGPSLGLPHGVLAASSSSHTASRGGLLGFGVKGSSGSAAGSSAAAIGGKGLSLSRNVHDDDEDLVAARMEVTRLELQFSDAAQKGTALISARSGVTTQLHALSNRLHTFAGVEATRPLAAGLKFPEDLKALADGIVRVDLAQQATSHSDSLSSLYQLAYQANNARSAKEALLARNALVEEHFEASKRALVKKREIESLKVRMGSHSGNGTITRDRIELAIQDFHEASRYAAHLKMVLDRMGAQLHGSLRDHSRNAHSDLKQALQEHAKGSVFHLRKEIAELKRLRAMLRGEQVDAVSTMDGRDSVEATDREASTSMAAAVAPASLETTQPKSQLSVGQGGLARSSSTASSESERTATMPSKLESSSEHAANVADEESQQASRSAAPASIEESTRSAQDASAPPVSDGLARGTGQEAFAPSVTDTDGASESLWSSRGETAESGWGHAPISQSAFLPPTSHQSSPFQRHGLQSPPLADAEDRLTASTFVAPTPMRNPSLSDDPRSGSMQPPPASMRSYDPSQPPLRFAQPDLYGGVNTSRFASASPWAANESRSGRGDSHEDTVPRSEEATSRGGESEASTASGRLGAAPMNTGARGGFGSGARGSGSGRGRGRISASEAARTLAGRF